MATKRPSDDTSADTGSEISVGPLRARGEAAKTVARYAPTLLLLTALAGGIPAAWRATTDLSAIRTKLDEIEKAQAAHVAESRLALARLPSADDLQADHDEIVQLRATVASCCGTQEVDRARRGARLDRLPVSVDDAAPATPDEASAVELDPLDDRDAGASTPAEAVRDTSADTTPVPVDPRGIAGR